MTLKKSVIDELKQLETRVFELQSDDVYHFEQLALEIFEFQYTNNLVYKSFVDALKFVQPKKMEEIPFLPISFFKTHTVLLNDAEAQTLFLSSGTTSSERSKHSIPSLDLYEKSFLPTYNNQIGNPSNQVILALLPNYLEQGHSSLVYMVNTLIEKSQNPLSGFLLNQVDEVVSRYKQAISMNKEVVIFGVSYALLELAEKKVDLSQARIIETGGMKGRRKEMSKEELHQVLCTGLQVDYIFSEYGMTELLSQAYSKRNGFFTCPPWMRILIRDINDPFYYQQDGKTGGINVIDLANLYSCSFIATQDLGKKNGEEFKIIGRFDNADIRGCNLLVQ